MTQSKDIGKQIVYTDGRIWSKYSNKWLTTHLNQGGYLKVKLNGKKHSIHRLIAQAFLPNPDNLPEVDHINNNKQDNRVENLQWVSAFYNRSKAHKDGLIPYCYGEANGRSAQNRIKYSQTNPSIKQPGKVSPRRANTKITLDFA
jgi:hypothetical protein